MIIEGTKKRYKFQNKVDGSRERAKNGNLRQRLRVRANEILKRWKNFVFCKKVFLKGGLLVCYIYITHIKLYFM